MRSDSRLVGLHVKDMPLAGPFAISKNWLGQGGAISPLLERFSKMSQYHRKSKNIYTIQ